jgi:CoA:oxalate CoA-transferase
MPTDEAVYRCFEEYRVPFAEVLSTEEAMAHPHLRERATVVTVKDRFLGEFDVPGFPLRFSEYPRGQLGDAPTLGEDNASILREYLDYSPDRIAKLEAEGVLRNGSR